MVRSFQLWGALRCTRSVNLWSSADINFDRWLAATLCTYARQVTTAQILFDFYCTPYAIHSSNRDGDCISIERDDTVSE